METKDKPVSVDNLAASLEIEAGGGTSGTDR